MRGIMDHNTILRALSVTGIVIVLGQHINMSWWEGGILGFSVMMLMLINDRNYRK